MLIVMQARATEQELRAVCGKIEALGYRAHQITGAQRTAVAVTGPGSGDISVLEGMPGVAEVVHIGHPYKLSSREAKPEDTVVRVGDASCGGRELAIIAGPCAVESEEQALAIAERVTAAGAKFFRGGAFKPRTSPYSFQGLGHEGLRILKEVRAQFGLKIVTEAMDTDTLDAVAAVADVIQVGSRNMQNFPLLRAVGRLHKPVLLKRGMSATLDELLMSAEYILAEGNGDVILCERGVRTFADHARNTLDLSIIAAVHRVSHLPIIADPSHAAGHRSLVPSLARAAVATGADGLIMEVHHQPERALSDGAQALLPDEFEHLMEQARQIAAIVGRQVAEAPTRSPVAAAVGQR